MVAILRRWILWIRWRLIRWIAFYSSVFILAHLFQNLLGSSKSKTNLFTVLTAEYPDSPHLIQYVLDSLSAVLTAYSRNHPISTDISGKNYDFLASTGARGNDQNIQKIFHSVGEVRIAKSWDEEYFSTTIVEENYLDGLKPDSIDKAAIAAKESVRGDKLVTQQTGYLYRKMSYALRDLKWKEGNEESVAISGGKLYFMGKDIWNNNICYR